jgi:1-acyl-sn-glycerol-3-phosphate acyltransferase
MRFSCDSYDTPENVQRLFGDKLAMGTSLYFYYRFLWLIYHTNRMIKKGKFSNEEWCNSSYYNIDTLEGCGAKLHIRGLDNIKKNAGPVVFVSNHMSTLETFTLPGIICPIKPSSFIVKQNLIDNPFFGRIMRATLAIAVTREDPVKDYKTVMADGKRLIDSGRSVIVFPQSTRGSKFLPEEFNSIANKLAKNAGVPVIPIALKTDFWRNGKYIKDIGLLNRGEEVYFEFGPAIKIEGNGKTEHNNIISFIQQKLDEWEN